MASTNLGTTIGNALLGLRESGVAPGVRSNPLRSQLLADAIAESNASAANLPQSQFEGLARGFLQGFTGANAADDRNAAFQKSQDQERQRSQLVARALGLPEGQNFDRLSPSELVAVSTARNRQGPQLTSTQKDLIAAGIDPNSEEGQRVLKARLAPSGTKVSVNPETGSIEFAQGRGVLDQQGGEISSKTQGAAEERIVSGLDTLNNVQRIRDDFDPEFFTIQGKVGLSLDRLEDSLGRLDPENPDDQQQIQKLGQARRLRENINTIFNDYRRIITGAAASVKELDALKKATLNEDLGPAEFRASLDNLESKIKQGIQLRYVLLNQGFSPGSKAFGREFDRRNKSGEFATKEETFQVALDQGLSAEDAAEQLLQLGFRP